MYFMVFLSYYSLKNFPAKPLGWWAPLHFKSRLGKLKVCGWLLCWVFETETHLQGRAYQSLSIIQALFSLYFLYTICIYKLMVCLRGRCGKTNKYTCIDRYMHFSKKQIQISRRTPTVDPYCGHASGLISPLYLPTYSAAH